MPELETISGSPLRNPLIVFYAAPENEGIVVELETRRIEKENFEAEAATTPFLSSDIPNFRAVSPTSSPYPENRRR